MFATMSWTVYAVLAIAARIASASLLDSAMERTCTPEEMGRENFGRLGGASNHLAIHLYRRLAAGTKENLFISPMGISTVFAMLYYGAKGETAQELRNVLGYNSVDLPDELVHITFSQFLKDIVKGENDGCILKAANAILNDKDLDILPNYKDDVQALYQATIQDVDFARDTGAVVNTINDWVKTKTDGRIGHLVSHLDSSTLLVLLNAVYFKGTWRIKFKPENTMQEYFYNYGETANAKEVPLMHMQARFRHYKFDEGQVLELPYKGDNLSMVVLLPDRPDGLGDLEQGLTLEKWNSLLGCLVNNKVILALPRFKLEYTIDLSDVVSSLGAQSLFQPELVDLSGMAPSKEIFVTQVQHKASVEVNEEGSLAAAATEIATGRARPLVDTTARFRVDHPFLFGIVERSSGMILFMGRVCSL